jgi:hypothetical protein
MSVAKPLDCYLGGAGTVPASNADIGMMRQKNLVDIAVRQKKLVDIADGLKRMSDTCARLTERADRIERSRRDEAGDLDEGDPEGAKPLAARS